MKIRNKVAGGAVSAIVAALCLSAPIEAAAANLEGRWKQHSAAALRTARKESQVHRIIEGNRYVYFIVRGAIFDRTAQSAYSTKMDIDPLQIFCYDKTQPWAEGAVKSLSEEADILGTFPYMSEYSPRHGVLTVGYDNGVIDFVYDDGRLVRSEVLGQLDVPYYKLMVFSATFDKDEPVAYVAGTHGIAAINMEDGSLRQLISTENPVAWAGKVGSRMVAFMGDISSADYKTETYVLTQDNNGNYSEAQKLNGASNLQALMPLGDDTFAALAPAGNDKQSSLNSYTLGENGEFAVNSLATGLTSDDAANANYRHLFRTDGLVQNGKEGYIVHSVNNIYIIKNENGSVELQTIPKSAVLSANEKNSPSATLDGSTVWFYTYETKGENDNPITPRGFYSRTLTGGNWGEKTEVVTPNGCKGTYMTFADWNPKYGMLFRGPGTMFDSGGAEGDALCSYKNSVWTDLTYSATNVLYVRPTTYVIGNNSAKFVVTDPLNPDWIWGSINRGGLHRMDLANPSNHLELGSKYYNSYQTNYPGYFPIFEPQKDWNVIINISNVDFDNDGTMWFMRQRMSSYSEDGSIEYDYYADVIKNAYTPIYYLTAEERERIGNIAADQSQLPDILSRAIKVPRAAVHEMCTINALKSEKNKNILAINSGAYVNEYQFSFFVDHNGTPGDTSDDRYALCDELYDTNGERIYYKFEKDIYEDPLTGDVWLLTASGPLVIDPQSFLAGDKTVRKVKIEKGNGMINDGATFEFITVNKVCHDYMGRKWLATETGLYCLSPDTKEMLGYYTIDNSPLPSNDVFNVVYNPETLSLFVMTEKGLSEFIPSDSNAPLASGNHLSVWPTAVSPHYMGYVNISGADNSAEYEVNDKEGKVIVTLGKPEGGLLQWNLKDAAGSHVDAGRYNIRRSGTDEIQPVIVY